MKRFLFIHTNGIKYEVKGRNEDKMLQAAIREGITPANGWSLVA